MTEAEPEARSPSLVRLLTVALVFSSAGVLACQPGALEPAATLTPAGKPEDRVTIDEFGANLDLNEAIEALALRRPDPRAAAAHQIDAMAVHVERHSRGVDRAGLRAALADVAKRHSGAEDQRGWLEEAAMLLLGYLSDERAEADLSRVALGALAKDLGDDAWYLEADPEAPQGRVDLLPEVRDGIGVVKLRHLDKDMGDRFLALFSGWAALEPPLRAVVLDLSECQLGATTSTLQLVNTFAPGQTAFGLLARFAEQPTPERREFRADASSRVVGFDRLPVFVQLSQRSNAFAEAVALALRRYRGARVLGTLSAGDGRVPYFHALGPDLWFGFTRAEVLASDGTPLRGHPVVPDACVHEGELLPLVERTEAAYREHCDPPDAEIRVEAVVRFVRELLVRESTPEGVPPPKTQ
jgi:hypothetical protein